jgi:hypothetical protein
MLWKWHVFSQITPPPPRKKQVCFDTQRMLAELLVWHVCYACQHYGRTFSTPGWLHRTLKTGVGFSRNRHYTRAVFELSSLRRIAGWPPRERESLLGRFADKLKNSTYPLPTKWGKVSERWKIETMKKKKPWKSTRPASVWMSVLPIHFFLLPVLSGHSRSPLHTHTKSAASCERDWISLQGHAVYVVPNKKWIFENHTCLCADRSRSVHPKV